MVEMGRLIVVSNRLPVSVTLRAGDIGLRASTGGLVTGLASLKKEYERFWVGWPGIASEKLQPRHVEDITEKLASQNCAPVFLSRRDIEHYYEGFCNKTIWPLFHYFPIYAVYEQACWQAYEKINKAFCREVLRIAKPGDSIWIHDYQLMLLPRLIRQAMPDARIGFFLHIPFPSFEVFRLLPWRQEVLDGILGADLIGFHTYDYVRHFFSSTCRIAGLEHHTLGQLIVGDRLVKVDAFPMGIDFQRYSQAAEKPKVKREIESLRKKVGDRKVIVSVDRLDYTKGIIQRLEAFDLFLSQNPEYKDRVTLILLAVPSRTSVDHYMAIRNQLEALVGRINGEHGSLGWVPVWYLYRAVPFDRLIALYNLADAALITPLRDGMNLVSKEFLATKNDDTGVLILSEMAGAARELGEALIVNAQDKIAIVQAIKDALEMPVEDQTRRNRLMRQRLSRYDISRWAAEFVNSLTELKRQQQQLSVRRLSESVRRKLLADYAAGRKRLLFLDYDGTLLDFVDRHERAQPDKELLDLLEKLASDANNQLVIISGRQQDQLDHWLGQLNISLVAEHGAWIRKVGQDWTAPVPPRSDWKDTVRPIMELYVDRTPGSNIEDKDFSMVWHCRRTDPALADVRTQELKDALLNMTENLDLGVYEGSSIIEVKSVGINKGRAVELWLAQQESDFILAAGDDYTDEDMFAALPEQAYSIKVGHTLSKARFNVNTVSDIRQLLTQLIGE